MRKTDKKIDNSLRQALMQVCDVAQSNYEGFEWLTHFVNYDRFPNSLSVVCVFDTQVNLHKADQDGMRSRIKEALAFADIRLNDVSKHVTFDTEESCNNESNGKWNARFQNKGLRS